MNVTIFDRLGFVERLETIRSAAGLNKSAFADKIQVKNVFSRYSSGEIKLPSVETLLRISDIFSVNLHWLLTGEGSPESTTAEESKSEPFPTTLDDFQRWAVTACEKDPKLEQWLSIELNIIKNRAALNTPPIKGGDDD